MEVPNRRRMWRAERILQVRTLSYKQPRLLKSSIGVTWELHCGQVAGECRKRTWNGSREKRAYNLGEEMLLPQSEF